MEYTDKHGLAELLNCSVSTVEKLTCKRLLKDFIGDFYTGELITNQLLYRLSYLGFCVFNINFAIFVPHPIFQSCIILHLFAVMSDFLSDFVYHLQKG